MRCCSGVFLRVSSAFKALRAKILFWSPDYPFLQNIGIQTRSCHPGFFALIILGNKGLKHYLSVQIHVYLFKILFCFISTPLESMEQIPLQKSLDFTAHA